VGLRDFGVLHGKIVTAVHGYDMSRFLRRAGPAAYQRLLRKGDLFLPVSQFWSRRLQQLGCPGEKIAVHHMGVDCARFAFTERAPRQGADVRLLSVARLVEKKGIAYAIKAVAELAREWPTIRYKILGDGPLMNELSSLVA